MPDQPSQRTLERTPERALRFLRAVGTRPAIRGILATHGFTERDQREGWALLLAASGFDADLAPPPPTDDGSVRRALAALDAWDEDGFRLARAALRRRHPAQDARVFADLEAERGAGSVIAIQRFLQRLDELERGDAGDQAALMTLAARGIDVAERVRLAALVDEAQAAPEVTMPDADAADAAHEAYVTRLSELRAWYDEWADTARSVIKRRDHLIGLGLASRRARGGSDTEPELEADADPEGGTQANAAE